MQHAGPGVININHQGKIISFSPIAEILFGWSASDILGSPITTIFPEVFKHKQLAHDSPSYLPPAAVSGVRPFRTQGFCRDGFTISVKLLLIPWEVKDQIFMTLLVDTPDAAEGYTASLMAETELVQEIAVWAGLPAVIDRAAGWFERAHPGSRMWLRVRDAEGVDHIAASPQLPEDLAQTLRDTHYKHIEMLVRKFCGKFTAFSSDSKWPEAVRRAALANGLYYGGIQLIGIQPDHPVGVLAVFWPEDPIEAQHFHALDKAAELVVLAAELGRAERRAREARAAFSALLNAAVDAIIVIDDQGDIVTFNAAAERIFGYHAQEVIGRNIKLLMPKPYRDQHKDHVKKYLLSKVPNIIGIGREIMAQRKDGKVFPVDLAVGEVRLENTSRFVGIMRDISLRKRTESLLRQQEEELRLTFQNAPMGIITLDKQGRFLNANQAFCKMLQYSETEIRKMDVEAISHADDLPECLEHLQRAFRGEFETESFEIRYVCKNGKHLHGVMHSSVVRDAQGHPLRLVAQVEDITERLMLEAEARQHRERLAHLTRLSTMGEMAAGIAHEINQPLTAIASYTQACRRRLAVGRTDHAKLLDLLEKVNEQALRAGEVMRRLCALVKKRESQHELADINELVKESVSMAKADTRLLDCRIEMQLDGFLPFVVADPVQIQQIILNLIRNGVDAMETVSPRDRVITIKTGLSDSEHVEIDVSDRGIGLSDAVAKQLFNPFFTTKPSGMGMGLSISRSIITSHGGRLWFTNNADTGTTFHFTLSVAI